MVSCIYQACQTRNMRFGNFPIDYYQTPKGVITDKGFDWDAQNVFYWRWTEWLCKLLMELHKLYKKKKRKD